MTEESAAPPPDYRPSPDEPYMNPRQLAYFRQKLLDWRASLLAEERDDLRHLREAAQELSDVVDRATQESEHAFELRVRERHRKLIQQIDEALRRIDDGSYGYCEDTGEEIGLARLEARPTASLCLEAQEKRERQAGLFHREP